jgi:hypothetical protein
MDEAVREKAAKRWKSIGEQSRSVLPAARLSAGLNWLKRTTQHERDFEDEAAPIRTLPLMKLRSALIHRTDFPIMISTTSMAFLPFI